MRDALLLEYFRGLPQLPDGDFFAQRSVELHVHLERFRKQVKARYNEGTLLRVLHGGKTELRRAAVVALGLMGTMAANAGVARHLHDEDLQIRRLAADALWNIWFRAEGESNRRELQRLSQLPDLSKSLQGLSFLLDRCPGFAEAYNQRAIVYFRLGKYQKSAADCRRALERNPFHFGAQAGLAQCLLKMKRPRAALRALRQALKINPELEGVAQTIRDLEESLGDGK
jgi:tetratricopeptide (TPR) repeat protein